MSCSENSVNKASFIRIDESGKRLFDVWLSRDKSQQWRRGSATGRSRGLRLPALRE